MQAFSIINSSWDIVRAIDQVAMHADLKQIEKKINKLVRLLKDGVTVAWTPKVCIVMALWAILIVFWP